SITQKTKNHSPKPLSFHHNKSHFSGIILNFQAQYLLNHHMKVEKDRKLAWSILSLIIAGLIFTACIILALRSGGPIRILALLSSLGAGYAIFEIIRTLRKQSKNA
ncbi:MAG: hypothetical protein P8H98_00150, partial [Flavobacteriales bacterium]|nr:hypothetical protein [Flavobacteriales bacterium]